MQVAQELEIEAVEQGGVLLLEDIAEEEAIIINRKAIARLGIAVPEDAHLVLAAAEIAVGHSGDGVLLTAEDDLGGESWSFAMGQVSIDCYAVARGGLAADADFQAARHFLSQSPVEYRAMKGLCYPQRFGGAPKRSERVAKNEA
jgi:hypothetical protein